MTTSPGRSLAGRYRLLDVIGRGGMGTVWRARDELLGREVAVKKVKLPAGMRPAERETLYQRTIREAGTAARLNHPSVITIHDVATEDGVPWIVMELVPARPLDTVVAAEGPLSPQRTARIGAEILGALRTAHAAGVLHRDVKPANVLIGDGDRVVLTDFGIATVEGDASVTQSGLIVGSPAYVAPERARGERATPASDLWALGATLFTAVEGYGPYDRETAVAALSALLTDDPPRAVHAGPLAPVIEGLLVRDPERRMNAEEVAAGLDEVIAGVTPWIIRPPSPAEAATAVLLPPGPPETPPRRTRPARFPMVLGLLMLAGSLAGGAWVVAHDGERLPGMSLSSPAPAPARGPTGAPPRAPAPSRSTAAPEGYQVLTDPLGFRVTLPEGWRERDRANGSVTYAAPGDTSYLMVDRSTRPAPDPLAALTDLSASARRTGRYPHLTTLRLQSGTYLRRPAADWEFTWRLGDGTTIRCLDRQVALPGGRALTVYWQTAGANWSADQARLATALRSLRLTDA